MYAISHQVSEFIETGFGLAKVPDYAKNYCFAHRKKRRGRSWYSGSRGSSKVLVRPQNLKRINIHGFDNLPVEGFCMKHFDTEVTRLKAWHGIHRKFQIVKREPTDFC